MSEVPPAETSATTTPPAPPAPPRRRSRWLQALGWFFGGLLALLLILLGALGWLLGTDSGLQALIGLARDHAPGTLVVEQAEGRVLGDLRLSGFDWRDGELHVHVARLELDWSPRRLLEPALHISRLAVSGVALKLPPPAPPPEPPPPAQPFTLPNLALPLAIELDNVMVDGVRVQPAAGAPVVIDSARLAARYTVDGLTLDHFDVRMPGMNAGGKGHLAPAGRWPTTIELGGHLDETPLAAPLDIRLQLAGTLDRFELKASTRGAVESTVTASVDDALGLPRWAAEVQALAVLQALAPELGTPAWQLALEAAGTTTEIRVRSLAVHRAGSPLALTALGGISLAPDPAMSRIEFEGDWRALAWPIDGPAQIASPEGHFQVSGTQADWRTTLKLLADVPEAGRLATEASVRGDTAHAVIESLAVRSPDGPAQIDASARVSFADLRFAVDANWRQLGWPLKGKAQYASPKGRLQAEGTPKQYTYALELDAAGDSVPPLTLKASGDGSDEAARLATLAITLLDGRIDGKADVRWAPRLEWEAELAGQKLDPGRFAPEWPGRIAFELTSDGHIDADGQAQAHVLLSKLDGRLRDQPLDGRIDARVSGANLDLPAAKLVYGGTRLDAEGRIHETWDLRWKLAAPDLARAAPGLRGRLSGDGQLSGPRERPQLQAKLDGQNLGWPDGGLQTLTVRADVDSAGRRRSELHVDGRALALAGQSFERLQLDADGTAAAHRAELTLNGAPVRAALRLSGRIDGEQWLGRLERLDLLQTGLGDWKLEQPASIRLATAFDAAKVSPLCLASRPTRLCVQADWRAADGGTATLKLTKFVPDKVKKFLPPELALQTSVDADAEAVLGPGNALKNARALVTIAPGRVRWTGAAAPIELPVNGRLEAKLDAGSQLDGRLQFGLGGSDGIDAEVRTSGLTAEAGLSGRVRANFNRLDLLPALSPEISRASGRVNADLTLGGKLSAPTFRGRAGLSGGGFELPALGLKLQDVAVLADGDGQGGLRFTGGARSGSGHVALDGAWQPASQRFRLHLSGEDFQAADSSTLKLRVSPELTAQLADGTLRIDGEVHVPYALIKPPDRRNVVSPSDDVYIVGDAHAESTPMAIQAQVRVTLGDDVRIDAPGFKARLLGSIVVEQVPPLAPRATGALEVESGEYEIFGQKLDIERGRLLFSGGPVDNPGLDLRATRTVDDVVAGARIGGSAKRPELKLFSEPSMPDASVLSYLVFGQAPGANSGSESALLMRAVAALGTGGASNLTGGIGKSLGFDQFGFESGGEDGVKGASLMLGKYLTPKLYVSYGVGLFEPTGTFLMRYKITDWLSAEARSSGTATGGDLIYTLEKGGPADPKDPSYIPPPSRIGGKSPTPKDNTAPPPKPGAGG